MDNITHTLLGIAAGEAVAVTRKKARVPLWIASGLANNLPDLDLLVTKFLQPGKLGYLLHHRGHSHTLALALPLAILLLAILCLVWRKRRDLPWPEILFLALLGPVLHLVADSWNSYGVHPFWPFRQDWVYGDSIFIVEPMIWLSILPMIFFACTSRGGKLLSLLLLAFINGLAWYHEAVPRPAALGLTVGTVFLMLFFKSLRWPIRRVTLSWGLVLALVSGMGWISHRLAVTYGQPGAELALTPMPANPFCWSALAARLDESSYEASVALLAPFPTVVPVSSCPSLQPPQITAPLVVSPIPDTAGRKVFGVFRAPRVEFDALVRNCQFNAFLRFARIPFWKRSEAGWVIGDLRYDREEGIGFSEMEIDESGTDCPHSVPPWIGRFHPERVRF